MTPPTRVGWIGWLAVVAAAVTAFAIMAEAKRLKSVATGCPVRAVYVKPGQEIQTLVSAAREGATFCIGAGVHRLQSIWPKDRQQFIGEPGAILNGSRLLTGAIRSGSLWVMSDVKRQGRTFGDCLKQFPACNRSDGVFLDNVPLMPVLDKNKVGSGRFYFDHEAKQLFLGDDPSGRALELSTSAIAVHNAGAKGVVVRGLIIEKYANPAQVGAIASGDKEQLASDWLVERNEVRYNTGVGIAAGPRSVIRANSIHHNGQLGITSNTYDVLVEDNEIFENNIFGYDADWEAGGMKAALAQRITIRGNRVHDNRGAGIWCDIDCRHAVIENNVVERNSNAGIYYEISTDGIIRNNRTAGNGAGGNGQKGRVWIWGAEIIVSASSRVQVTGNIVLVEDRSTGIILVDQGRKKSKERPGNYTDADGYFQTSDVTVRGNTIVYLGPNGLSGGVTDVPLTHPNAYVIERGRNRFDENTYSGMIAANEDRFLWGREPLSFGEFRELGQEIKGRFDLSRSGIAPR